MKKILATSLIAGSMLFASGHNVLTKSGDKKVEQAVAKAIQSEKNNLKAGNEVMKKSASRKEVIVAIKNMGEALFDLKRQDKVSAEAKIQYAIKTLKKIKEDVIPVEARLFILEFRGNIPLAKKMIKTAENMMKEKNYQGASEVLTLLKDEMDIMEIDVNKKALVNRLEAVLKLIKDNKLNEAFKELALTFRNPEVFVRAVGKYPLGVVKAAYLIQQAHILNNAKTKQYKDIASLIKEAKAELELDNVLGYFYTKPLQAQYKKLMKILDTLEKQAEANKNGTKYSEAEKAVGKIKQSSVKTEKNPRYQVIEPGK